MSIKWTDKNIKKSADRIEERKKKEEANKPKLLKEYKNGNYYISIYSDGTKVRDNKINEYLFIPEFPESIDLKITNRCNMECQMCHESSTIEGVHGDVLDAEFINTLTPGTELAIGGGNVFEHPDLIEFLEKLKDIGVIPNITVHQSHALENIDILNQMLKNNLIYGLGISFNNDTEEFIRLLNHIPEEHRRNIVVHVINGIVDVGALIALRNRGLKVLILGYKTKRKGLEYFNSNMKHIKENQRKMDMVLSSLYLFFKRVSFDNLAVTQLRIRDRVDEKIWRDNYMGDDGTYTMYIDLPNKKFAESSTVEVTYPLEDNIVDMFQTVVKNNPLNK